MENPIFKILMNCIQSIFNYWWSIINSRYLKNWRSIFINAVLCKTLKIEYVVKINVFHLRSLKEISRSKHSSDWNRITTRHTTRSNRKSELCLWDNITDPRTNHCIRLPYREPTNYQLTRVRQNDLFYHAGLNRSNNGLSNDRWTFFKLYSQKNYFRAPRQGPNPQLSDDRWDPQTIEPPRLRWWAKVQVSECW